MTNFVVNLADPSAADAERFGPKAANQAALGHAGLPTPGGFCLGADAYNHQVASLGLTEAAEKAVTLPFMESRGHVADVRIGLFSEPIAPEIEKELVIAYRALVAETGGRLAVLRGRAVVAARDALHGRQGHHGDGYGDGRLGTATDRGRDLRWRP